MSCIKNSSFLLHPKPCFVSAGQTPLCIQCQDLVCAHPRFLLLFCLPHIPAYSVLPSGKVPRDHLSLSFSPSYLTLQCHQNDHSKPAVPSTTCAQNPCKWLITDGLNCFSPEKKTFTVWVIFPALQTHTDTACSLLPHFTLQVFGVFMVSPRAVPCLHWTLQLSTSSSCVCTA